MLVGTWVKVGPRVRVGVLVHIWVEVAVGRRVLVGGITTVKVGVGETGRKGTHRRVP